jgi:hypothetical protein
VVVPQQVAAHAPVGDLLVDRARAVVRVHLKGRRGEVVNRVGAPLVLVSQPWAQAIDIPAPASEGQVPEHVIKRPVLQHHDHDMVDLLQVGGTGWITLVNFHRSSVTGQAGN